MRHFISTLPKKEKLVGAEVGVLTGAHAKQMLEGLTIKRLYLIDPYYGSMPNYEYALDELKKFEDKINWLILPSIDAARHVDDESLDFVYIDGLHSYEACWNDLTSWYPKVKEEGWVAGHDWTTESVRKAVKDFLENNEHYNLNTDMPDGDWYFQK